MNCDLDNCSLATKVEKQDEVLNETHDAVIEMTTKLDTFIVTSRDSNSRVDKQIDRLYYETKNVVRWGPFFTAMGAMLGGFTGIVGFIWIIVQLRGG